MAHDSDTPPIRCPGCSTVVSWDDYYEHGACSQCGRRLRRRGEVVNLQCPACNAKFRWEHLRNGPVCPECGVFVRFSRKQARRNALIAYSMLAVIGFLTYTPNVTGSWLLFLLLLGIPVRWVCGSFSQPELEIGVPQPRLTYTGAVIGCAFTIFAIEFVALVAMMMLVGGTGRDLQEQLEFLSVPLAWINTHFLLTRNSSFLDVCGVILGNSFFYGAVLYSCYFFVRRAFHRSRVTQISISDGSIEDED